jgi:hypothetical protein
VAPGQVLLRPRRLVDNAVDFRGEVVAWLHAVSGDHVVVRGLDNVVMLARYLHRACVALWNTSAVEYGVSHGLLPSLLPFRFASASSPLDRI